MVTVSIINPEVTYNENEKIDEEDIGYKSQVYELDLEDGLTISVVIGKPKYIFTSKNIIFFPIYAVQRSKIRAQIGVFEVKSVNLLNVYRQGEIDVNRLSNPLFYSFSNPGYLAKLEANPKLFETGGPLTPTPKETVSPILDEEMEEDARHLSLSVNNKTKLSKTHQAAKDTVAEGLFEDAEGFQPQDPLEEESKDDAEKERTEYKESSRNVWMEKFMKNNQYRIHEVESNGDCFFAVVRDAFASIGKKTTVEKLRAALSLEMTDEIYSQYREVYLSFLDEIQTIERDIKAIDKNLKEYKARVKQNGDKTAADTAQLVTQSKQLTVEKTRLQTKIKEIETMQREYTGDMSKIDTLEKMRSFIQTPSFWADSWAILTMERILNVKFVLFSQEAFAPKSGPPDLDGVLLCSEVSKEHQEKQSFSPDYYILATYSGDHYKLVSYKSRKIFQFREVPYDVKILVLNRCLARSSGVYYMIPDFRNWKTKFGIDEDEGVPDDFSESANAGELYDPATKFVFYAKSDKSTKPGKGAGEEIEKKDVTKYADLGKIEDWRKMLDDDWDKTPLTIDKKRWTSVTHYMLGARYKNTHPDVYSMFSVSDDQTSKLATSVKDARAFKGVAKEVAEPEKEVNEKKKKKPAEKKVQIVAPDMDYESREAEERATALKSKFLNNADLRAVLGLTQNALLLQKGKSGEPAVPDDELMRVRKLILTN